MESKSPVHQLLATAVGNWVGETKTWFEPNVLADQSPMSVRAEMVVNDSFLSIEYNGQIQGQDFNGNYICGYDIPNQIFQVSWIDSFHMGTGMMHLTGAPVSDGFDVKGTYTSPQMPEPWGWRIQFKLVENNELRIVSYNISPEGQEDMATETILSRIL